MKIYFYIIAVLLITFTACKKENTLPPPTVFATIKFDDPFGIFSTPNGSSLKITYQGKAIEPKADGSLLVLPGKGEFSFFNSTTNTTALTKTIDVDQSLTKIYAFFKPDPDADAVELIENNQAQEPKPEEDFVKVRIANFAQALFNNKDIKVVFNQNGTPVDTIATTGTDYTDGYSTMPRAFTIVRGQKRPVLFYDITFLDGNNQPVLNADGQPVASVFNSNRDNSVYTVFIKPDSSGGFPEIINLFVD